MKKKDLLKRIEKLEQRLALIEMIRADEKSGLYNLTPEMVFVEADPDTQDFEIGKYPVTQELYESVMGVNPSSFKGNNRPVENVSWYDAVTFCNKLSEKEGFTPVYVINGDNTTVNLDADGYRLPTEGEWEFAARGGSKSKGFKYAGSNYLKEVGWYDDNSDEKTHPVGQLEPNELGIHDLSGNVLEWCWDRWSNNYSNADSSDPVGPSLDTYRAIRGGCWYYDARHCRVAFCDYSGPNDQDNLLGFRVCRTVK